MMCVGGPYSGCLVDVAHEPVHGRKYMVDDWTVGPGTIPSVPLFSDEPQAVDIVRHVYTFVQFSGDGDKRWFLAYGTERGMWVLDELVQMARRKTLGDSA